MSPLAITPPHPFPIGSIVHFPPNTPLHIYSNFSASKVVLDGLEYPTVEHAFQAAKIAKAELRSDLVVQDNVLGMTAGEAKKWGRAQEKRPDWYQVRVQIMYDLLCQKFKDPASDISMSRRIWLTGDRLLVEGNYWHDQDWGKCYCPKHKWSGQNMLGRLLMKIRWEISLWSSWSSRRLKEAGEEPFVIN